MKSLLLRSLCGVEPSHPYWLLTTGGLITARVGNSVRTPAEALREWMARKQSRHSRRRESKKQSENKEDPYANAWGFQASGV